MPVTSSASRPTPSRPWRPEANQPVRGLALVWRHARLIAHLLYGQALVIAVLLGLIGRAGPERLTQAWNRRLLRILGVQLRLHGQPATASGRMTVANHVSWLDIPLIAACEPTRFVAKSEIRHWPIAGWLANAAGTFYIRRGKGGARPLLEHLIPHLQAGGAVTVFPEGTTTDGRQVLPFHARLLSAPQAASSWVQPVAIRYGAGHDGRAVAPFIGDDALFPHILRLLREPALQIDVTYCAPIAAAAYERDELARRAHAAICAALGLAAETSPAALAA